MALVFDALIYIECDTSKRGMKKQVQMQFKTVNTNQCVTISFHALASSKVLQNYSHREGYYDYDDVKDYNENQSTAMTMNGYKIVVTPTIECLNAFPDQYMILRSTNQDPEWAIVCNTGCYSIKITGPELLVYPKFIIQGDLKPVIQMAAPMVTPLMPQATFQSVEPPVKEKNSVVKVPGDHDVSIATTHHYLTTFQELHDIIMSDWDGDYFKHDYNPL